MKRNWLTAFVGTMLWGVGGLFAAGGVAPVHASDPAYCVCPYFAEDFDNTYAYGSDWYLLSPESKEADAFLAALDASEAEAEEANRVKAPRREAVPSPLPMEKGNCLIDKSTGESYAKYLVEQVYKLYFAEKGAPAVATNDRIVADPSDDATLLCPAEQDYLDWRLDALGYDEIAPADDEPVSEALASEASQKVERLELKPAAQAKYAAPQARYDWEAYEYDWCGADDPAFASAEEKVAVAEVEAAKAEKSEPKKSEAEKNYADAERLSAFEEYAIWEQNYGDCAEAAEAWAAVQNLEDQFSNYWDNVVLSGEIYVAPAKQSGSISSIVLNGSPSACTPTVKATLVRDEDFAAPGQYVATVREEESYPLEILATNAKRLSLSDEAVATIASSRVQEATELSTLNVATQPFLAFGETARRAIRDLVLSSDERAALRQVAAKNGLNAVR
ncbi:MAG TPA: hypothetical protein VGN57_03365 [Pirellulaceae bacterium]|jgi:hypothetical protein|nr:hypothetical protein [Pirellulaceae bacterium]